MILKPQIQTLMLFQMMSQGVMIEEEVSGVVLRSLSALEQWGKVEQLIRVMQV
jgi:hypothetical protein